MARELFLLALCSLFLISDAAPCNSTTNITDWRGTFESPNYPMPYQADMDCCWLFQVSEGNLIEITFQDFLMTSSADHEAETTANCPNDYVKIVDLSNGIRNVLARICGSQLVGRSTFRSRSNLLLVHMHSDSGANSNRGFLARHEGICNVDLKAASGSIMSPNHPNDYPIGVSCVWIIDLGLGYKITLTFHKFTLEKKEDCKYDWLSVREGNSSVSPEITRVCGDVLPPDITIKGPMRIEFKADTDNEFEGFNLTYQAQDQNECLEPDICHSNATCANSEGSYQCTCRLSYTGDGKNCTWYRDFDECDSPYHNCHEDGLCFNTLTHFYCRCKPGFLGDGINCTDIDECETSDLAHKHNCHRNASCSNTHGSFVCTCVSVYTGDGVTCTDIDECNVNTHTCHADGNCINTDGSFRCECKVGFIGNGLLCSDVDECTLETDNCHANAKCNNTKGSFACKCDQGYSGNGVNCTDVDECTLGTDNCHANAKCNNTKGSFVCTCDQGYSGNGVNCTGLTSLVIHSSSSSAARYLFASSVVPFVFAGVFCLQLLFY